MLPLVFEPYLRQMVWGGRRLGELFGKNLPDSRPYGESWEISGHPHHVSKVAEGPLRGALLTKLVSAHATELFGPASPPRESFPLLFKLLDCNELLSIQVHPSDQMVRWLCDEKSGKTEAWVVLDVGPNGKIFAGLKSGVDRPALERHIAAGTVADCLHEVRPRVGDCVYLPAGTVHAVGEGVVMAEIQQTSDATFRLFDWNRLGSDGKPRTLHIRESLEAIDWSRGPVSPSQGRPLEHLGESARGERLVESAYFELDRFTASASFNVPFLGQLAIWFVVSGNAVLTAKSGGYERAFGKGETVLIPASANDSLEWRVTSNAPPFVALRAGLGG